MDKELIEKIELNHIPTVHRKWKTLHEYRQITDFLPHVIREKVCEQLMACDYLLSIELWLKPISVIQKRHKLIFVEQVASIFEGVIDNYLDKKISILHQDSLAREICHDKYIKYRTFNTSIKLLKKLDLIKEVAYNYLIKLAEVRNYIHLTKDVKDDVMAWLDNQSSQDIRSNLDSFLNHARRKIMSSNK
jgi:hypothetical protein